MHTEYTEYMQRALQLATKGRGFVNPNPMVGAVIVKENRVIGEGYHTRYGAAHAEIEALHSATESVKGATVYVTLEPCSHYGKTPPCAVALVKAEVAKVVIAMLDPNPLVEGKGVALLKQAGIEVVTGILEREAQLLNRVFVKYITKRLPYVLLKTAMTLDGKIATRTGDSRWVSGELSRQKVHELRHSFMGVMVGKQTVLQDDPQLNCRLTETKVRQPVKIITDSTLQIPFDAKLWNGDLIIATSERATKESIKKYKARGAKVIVVGKTKVDLSLLLQELTALEIDSVLLEGGATLNHSALQAEIVDEVYAFVAPKIIGGNSAATFVGGDGFAKMQEAYKLKNLTCEPSGEDILLKGFIQKE